MDLKIELPEEQGGSPESQFVRDIAEAINEFEAMREVGESGIPDTVVYEDLRLALSEQSEHVRHAAARPIGRKTARDVESGEE